MQTLSYGFKLPESGDKGPVVFPALESNITNLNNHTHDGSNSAKISSAGVTPASSTIASGDWNLVGNGIYKDTITLPAAFSYDTTVFTCKLPSGHIVYPTIEKVSATTYDIYTNDNSIGMTVLYL